MSSQLMFFGRWRLQPSSSKTVCCVFHLHNARANQKLYLLLSGQQIRHEPNPVYLGVTMDRSLTFRSHLKKSAVKLGTRNNLLSKLAGSSWGAQASTLRTSALGICYSVAEYCAPVYPILIWTNKSILWMEIFLPIVHICCCNDYYW